MNADIQILIYTALSAGFVHTILGPDHYLPFVLLGKARQWSLSKLLGLTLICGIGHILSSVIIGLLGVAFGVAIEKLEFIESIRGNWAAWSLIAFGLVYAIWGLRNALKHRHHHHYKMEEKSLTPWFIFIIFVLGPCEILIPLLMYPAAKESVSGMLAVTTVFSISTITTMLIMVSVLSFGFHFVSLKKIGHYMHFIAGLLIAISGLAIQLLGV